MDTTTVIDVLREAVSVALKLGGPMLILIMLVGLVIAIFHADNQIHEQTISFMLKLILVLLIGGSWMLTTLQDYTKEIFALIAA